MKITKVFLSIAPVCPYDSIGHAGGKTYNYYLKSIGRETNGSVEVAFFARRKELANCDLSSYGIPYKCFLTSGNIVVDIKHSVLDIVGRVISQNDMFSLYKLVEILHHLKHLQKKNNLPDVIELEWTNFVYFAKYIKHSFPTVKIIASEHDVSYLGLERKGLPPKRLADAKKLELDALKCCDVVMPHNIKDRDLLIKDGIEREKIHVIVPYFHNMSQIVRKNINHDILFWGAMYRPENYEAAIWFIENVMPLLSDLPVRFVVAGNRPPEQLKKYASDRIEITGFVEDEMPLFESSMCFVSPLLTGAGIKVKVIEALSAGIPILTNTIGIEGIPAKDGESYFHCETPEEYAAIIRKIFNGEVDLTNLQKSQHQVIVDHFNLEKSVQSYIEMIKNL